MAISGVEDRFQDQRLKAKEVMAGGLLVYGGFPIPGTRYFVDATNGNDNYDGSNWDSAFATMEEALTHVASRDAIFFRGDVNESGLTTPTGIDFVSIIGAGNQPRSNRWRNTANAAEPHITLRKTGWSLHNIYFAGGTADYAVELLRDATWNSSETRILDCVFNGGSGHIQSNGGVANVIIARNRFINARGGTATTPGAIIGTSTAQAVPTNWVIRDNEFYNCARMIACSMSRSMVYGNKLQSVGHDGEAEDDGKLNLNFNSNQGDYNMVMHNVLGMAAASITEANGYEDGANSVWVDNYADDAVDYGLPTG